MSKELEALHTIAFNTQINGLNFGDELRIIEQALQRLEAIDNAKPSEALECWNYIKAIIPEWARKKDEKHPDILEPIKQVLLKAQEQEKVIKIVFEKPLSLLTLKLFKKYDKDRVLELDYQFFVDGYKTITEDLDEDMKEQIASEEEFELFKEWLECQKN